MVKELISAREYAKRSGYHANTVLHWIKAGLIPYVKHGSPKAPRYYILSTRTPPRLKSGPRPGSLARDLEEGKVIGEQLNAISDPVPWQE